MAAPRRRKIGHRRRVEDEGEDEGGPGPLDIDDDSLTDESLATDDHDAGDSDTSNIDETSPTSLNAKKSANGGAKQPSKRAAAVPKGNSTTDTDMMLHGLTITDPPESVEEIDFDDFVPVPPKSPTAPLVVSSASPIQNATDPSDGRRRQEHDDYKKKRDEDPAFVPNRGSFFMHDHRHPGPAANGFRPFGKGRGRGGRGGIGGPYAPVNQFPPRLNDPTTNAPWTHDMHESVASPAPRRSRQMPMDEGPPNGNGIIPTRESNPTPINRTLSTEKHIGNAQVRVLLPNMKSPIIKSGVPLKQYTKLPDHRPPLRRDKPVRISLPERPPRYIYPAADRSFIFIPRAMRPNQQRTRGKPRSGLGSVGGFSRRTSIYGGSYYGSMYSPSVAMSRRSSFAHDRDLMFSPTGSVISRAAIPVDNSRPVVRLPPAPRPDISMAPTGPADPNIHFVRPMPVDVSISDLPPPQTHPLPQKPAFQENLPTTLPMHQPRPQKNISVADIDSPALQGPQSFQPAAFHQQVPMAVPNGYHKDSHTRQPSYPSQHSTGTPLSQIPERAIHAAPFQPHAYGQQQAHQPQPYYGQQAFPAQPQQGFYYQGYSGPNMPPPVPAPAYVPAQPGAPGSYAPSSQADQMAGQPAPPSSGLVAQEVNGMVYYYDPSQMPPPVNTYPPYSGPQGYQSNVMGMAGMVTPSPDGFYYPQAAPGMVYYPQ